MDKLELSLQHILRATESILLTFASCFNFISSISCKSLDNSCPFGAFAVFFELPPGHTSNYILVNFKGLAKSGQTVDVKITSLDGIIVNGEIEKVE